MYNEVKEVMLMKNFKRNILVLLSLFLILSIVVSCSADNKQNSNESKSAEDYDSLGYSEMEEADFEGEYTSSLEPEKVITTIDLTLETTEFDRSNDELNKIIEKHDGYVEYSNISYNSQNFKNGEFVIRVPKDNVDSFKSDIKSIGNITWESTNKRDVTKQYTDIESRLKAIEVKEERILALMEKADKIEDIIVLEEQLSQVIYEKENLQSSLMNLDDKVDYSTINLSIKEVEKLSGSNNPKISFSEKIKIAFDESIYFFKDTIEKLIVLLIYILPFIIVFGIIGFGIYKGIIKLKNKKDD